MWERKIVDLCIPKIQSSKKIIQKMCYDEYYIGYLLRQCSIIIGY